MAVSRDIDLCWNLGFLRVVAILGPDCSWHWCNFIQAFALNEHDVVVMGIRTNK